MINEPTLLTRQWLEHELYGVVPMLETVPRTRIREATDDDLPSTPIILDDVTDADDLTEDLEPNVSPALIVFADSDMLVKPEDIREIARRVIIAIAYTTKGMGKGTSKRWSGYTLRAVVKSLHRWNKQDLARGYRELNGVKVSNVERVTYQPAAFGLGNSTLWGFVLASLIVKDTQP